jgi:hypothetical protein
MYNDLINRIDSFIDGSTYGRLIVENNEAYLETTNGLQPILDGQVITVLTDDQKQTITQAEAINTVTAEGWPLYAGVDCTVK